MWSNVDLDPKNQMVSSGHIELFNFDCLSLILWIVHLHGKENGKTQHYWPSKGGFATQGEGIVEMIHSGEREIHQYKTEEFINTSPPSAAYMRQWIGWALVQIMYCRLFSAKPLPKPMLGYRQLNP